MPKLVAFYSRADENYFGGAYRYIEVGNTEKAAKMIAELNGADLFKIEQRVPYAKDYNTCIDQAKKDKQAGARPELVSMPENLDAYDDIYLCYPNYWGLCRWLFTPFWKHLAGKERQSIRFVRMKEAGFPVRKEILQRRQRERR